MDTITKSRRRYAVPDGWEGSVEFSYPGPGEQRCVMPVKDISNSGLSFLVTHAFPNIKLGRTLENVTVRVGSYAVHGELLVKHITPDEAPDSVCGVRFQPATQLDFTEFKNLIADLKAEAGSG